MNDEWSFEKFYQISDDLFKNETEVDDDSVFSNFLLPFMDSIDYNPLKISKEKGNVVLKPSKFLAEGKLGKYFNKLEGKEVEVDILFTLNKFNHRFNNSFIQVVLDKEEKTLTLYYLDHGKYYGMKALSLLTPDKSSPNYEQMIKSMENKYYKFLKLINYSSVENKFLELEESHAVFSVFSRPKIKIELNEILKKEESESISEVVKELLNNPSDTFIKSIELAMVEKGMLANTDDYFLENFLTKLKEINLLKLVEEDKKKKDLLKESQNKSDIKTNNIEEAEIGEW